MRNTEKPSSALLFLLVVTLLFGCACNSSRVRALEEELKNRRDREAIYEEIIESRKKAIEERDQTIAEKDKAIADAVKRAEDAKKALDAANLRNATLQTQLNQCNEYPQQ